MNPTRKAEQKNAPLALPADRESFLNWALEQPDNGVTAGYQPLHPRLAVEAPVEVLRASAAKLVSLLRRERSQTPEQLAAAATVRVAEVLALEHGENVSVEAVGKIATALHLSTAVLVQLMGLSRAIDQSLIRAAMEFVSRLEAADPLDARETEALRAFRTAFTHSLPRAAAG